MPYRTAKLDRIAVQLSGLCLLHCLALPLLIACLPVLGLAEHGHEPFHELMLVVVVPLAVVSLGRGFARHRQARVIGCGALGVALLAVAALLVHPHAHIGHTVTDEAAERWMTVAGALILAGAHIVNARALRREPYLHQDCVHTLAVRDEDSVRTTGCGKPQ